MSKYTIIHCLTLCLGTLLLAGGGHAMPPQTAQPGASLRKTLSVREGSSIARPGIRFECPYLMQVEGCPVLAVPLQVESFPSVSENLQKLKLAAEYLRRADECKQNGRSETASYFYSQARKLCPGSRYDNLASVALFELQLVQLEQTNQNSSGEEQEMESTFLAPEQTTAPNAVDEFAAPEEVRGSAFESFLDNAKVALREGQFREAKEYAELAQVIDSKSEEAEILLFRIHLLQRRQAASSANGNND
jgi:hypothetical protein